MICEACVYLEIFGKKGQDKFFNTCGLLDIWNLEEGTECEYFKDAELAQHSWEIMRAASTAYPAGDYTQ